MRAAVPCTLPNAPRMPVCRRSAPAHESILLMRRQWNGCMRTRRWNASLPAFLTMYLFAAMRPASIASEEICSFSKLRVRGGAWEEGGGGRVSDRSFVGPMTDD
eukprot:11715-Pelagococcus_subviridis.AAC.3